MDVRYQKGKIYTIRCRDDNSKIYVGSTISPLSQRLAKHRSSSKNDKQKKIILYQNINGDWDNWYIELYENHPCNSREELEKREGEIIREIGSLNKNIVGRTKKEWNEDNKEILSDYKKKYYQENKQKLSENNKEYYENNKEILLKYQKEYWQDNKEKLFEQRKEYYDNNKLKLAGKKIIYTQENKKKIAEQRAKTIKCECGCEVRKDNLSNHKKTTKHLQLLNKTLQESPNPEVNLQ
tara:strand:+ start:90 stop:803 length:714 start_codon:yes stop_codon:yes gene_type:complete